MDVYVLMYCIVVFAGQYDTDVKCIYENIIHIVTMVITQ